MPWPRQHQLRAGSVQTCTKNREVIAAKRVNRYDRRHVGGVFAQALRLEEEEPVMLNEYWTTTEWPAMQPLRGVRRAGESDGAVMACNDYLQMPKRSLVRLHEQWHHDFKIGVTCKVPTLDTFKSWSRRFQWQARALLFDAAENDAISYELDHRRRVMRAVENELERRSNLKLMENMADLK